MIASGKMRGWLRVVLRRSGEELGGGYQRRRDWGVCECMNEKRVGEVEIRDVVVSVFLQWELSRCHRGCLEREVVVDRC